MVRRRFEEISDRSRAQANQHFRFLRALLGWAMWRYGNGDGSPLIPENPCQILTKLKCWHRIDRRTGYVEPNQLKVFMDALVHQPGDSDGRTSAKDLCALLLLTGLREQEGCGLLWSDIDLNRRQITIRNPKNHRDHTLPIGKWLAKLIADRRTFARSSLYLFPAENKTGHLRHHHRQIVAIRRISGIKFRLHDLRRTFATIVTHDLERSFSAYTIKRLLNHSITGDVTAGYIQTPVETLREPMEMVERFILRSSGPLTDANVVRIRPTMGDELPKAATA
jgi:integrase